MKIEKKKVVKSSKLSKFTKSAVAAALGIAASIGTTACDDSISAIGDDNKKQEPEPTCGETACGEQFSSSSYTDISSSGEHLSSEAIEALSSAKQPKSSSSIISAGIPHTYSSSSVEKPSSSSYEPMIEAGILPPYEDNPDVNSSSDMAPVSSANVPSSSSEVTEQSSSSSDIDIKPAPIDTIDLNPRVYLCPDGTTSCLMVSMVTTFEHDDIQA
jgi:hypothetical protein